MSDTPSGFKNRRNTPFTMLANTMLRDPQISLKAKGMLGVMLSFPDGWQYYLKHLETLSTDGRDAHRTAIQELERAGYVIREQTRDEFGQLSVSLYRVSDEVRTVDGLSGDGKPVAGKPAPIKKDKKNTEDRNKYSSTHTAKNSPETGSQDSEETRIDIPERLAELAGFDQAWKQWLKYKGPAYLDRPMTVRLGLDFLAAQPDPLEVIKFTIRTERANFVVKPAAAVRAERNRSGAQPATPAPAAVRDDGEIDMDALLRTAPLNGRRNP